VTDPFYTSSEWLAVREQALARDRGRCSVARLIGGDCSATLHVHHLKPRKEFPELALDLDNLLTVCASHHPTLEAVRRLLLVMRLDSLPRCTHRHPYESGRRACEERRRRQKLERRAHALQRAA
jgi:5-methylcytosine-specific restriction endonuclease McrA